MWRVALRASDHIKPPTHCRIATGIAKGGDHAPKTMSWNLWKMPLYGELKSMK
jgi:hypothetical protein